MVLDTEPRTSARRRQFSFRRLERSRHYVIVRQKVIENGLLRKRPVLWLLMTDNDGTLSVERYEPLLDYYADNASMSYAWMKNSARGIGVLIDHSIALGGDPSFRKLRLTEDVEKRLLRGLASSLIHGTTTIGPNGRLVDRTGLKWSPLGKPQAGVILAASTRYFNWLREQQPGQKEWLNAFSTRAAATDPTQSIRLASELVMRRENALLSHLEATKRQPAHPFPGLINRTDRPASAAVPTFPTKYAVPFLYRGFRDSEGEGDEAAQLLSHLIFSIGIRKSEGFHLYTSDIQFIRDVPWVFFHHPQQGLVETGSRDFITRQEYLQRFGLLPRNISYDRLWAGWKGMANADNGTPGFFLPIPELRGRVGNLLKHYIFKTRPSIMAARPRHLPDHPFLLVTSGRTASVHGGDVGDPYTMSAFENSWGQAVRRIGREFDDPAMLTPRKRLGTTPHGGRHFYGRFLFSCELEGKIIQSCMHHKSLLSHEVYTRLTVSEINEILQHAAEGGASNYSFGNLHANFMNDFNSIPRAFAFH